MQNIENVLVVKMKILTGKILIFFLFLFGEAVLTSTHNLCFGAKIREKKIGIPLQFCYIKVVYKGYVLHAHIILMY